MSPIIKEEPYCNFSKKRLYREKQKQWENGYQLYLKEQTWRYDFESEASFSDDEQSFLSQMIFGHLLKSFGYIDFQVKRYYMYVKGKNNQNIVYYFDVMNNPSASYYIGKKAQNDGCENLRKEWENKYHTIGNFTPIPWSENIQRKHRNLSERWDLLLRYFKECWGDWKERGIIDISFNEYMKCTCQHLYYEKIFQSFKDTYSSKLEEINSEKWKELIHKWNGIIGENENLKIISFEGNIDEVVKDINLLIEARGRCIFSLLSIEN